MQFQDDFSPKGAFINKQWYAADFRKDGSIEQRLHNFFDFIRERHAIFLRKQKGLPRPWTNDPILSQFRFCNVYRELDTVSQWIIDNVIHPHEDDPNLWFMLCASRIINWPPSLTVMMDVKGGFGIKGLFNPQIAYDQLIVRKKAKQKVITGAYIVNSVTTDRDPDLIRKNKLAYICFRTLGEIWEARVEVQDKFKDTLQQSVETLKHYQGYGPFMSYQITVDLTYSNKWLGKASDYNTFNSAGPGTCRGLSRVFHNEKRVIMEDSEKTRLLAFQLKASQNPDYWPNTSKNMKTGFAPLSMSNISNCNCEYDKWTRVCLGQGKMRSRYESRKETSFQAQKSLF